MTKEAKRRAHRARMAERRAHQLARTYAVKSIDRKGNLVTFTTPPPITANLSRKHPDYGKSPRDHAAAKAARSA